MCDKRNIIRGRKATDKDEQARRMRREMTPAEAILWEQLRGNRLRGLHFRRQQVIDGLIVDFYCHETGLVVEADGPVHEAAAEHDADRDALLRRRGLIVLRFRNERIIEDTEDVLQAILAASGEQAGGR